MTAARVAVVTGVSRGLGEAIAAGLLDRGFIVAGIGRNSSAALAHQRYRFCACDLSDLDAIDAAVGPVMQALAAQDAATAMLVNNAAAAEPVGRVGALHHADLARTIRLDLVAPAVLADLFCRHFTDAGCERLIVNISSGAAQAPLSGAAAYCMAKAGLEMLARVIAAEGVAPTLRAISLRPGIVDTEMQRFMRSQTREALPSVQLFKDFHGGGKLVPPREVARRILERVLDGVVENGRVYSY